MNKDKLNIRLAKTLASVSDPRKDLIASLKKEAACIEHVCKDCKTSWMDNRRGGICHKCGSDNVTSIFDEASDNSTQKISEVIPDDGEPYIDESEELEEKEAEWVSFSFGTTPEEIIKERALKQTPNGYPMTIKDQETWTAIANAVNKGIDSHLEGFTRSTFDNGSVNVHPEEMTTLLRRLYEDGSEEAWSLRTDILSTLNVEEI